MIKKAVLAIGILVSSLSVAFAQNQGSDLSLGRGGDAPAIGRVNEAYTDLASGDGKANYIGLMKSGALIVNTSYKATVAYTNPSVANTTSVTVLAANANRKGYRVQNNSAANICCSEAGATLTNITGTSCNVLVPGASLDSKPNAVSQSAITCYQSSGGAITTITVAEWQ